MSSAGAHESIESAAQAACEWPAEESGTHRVIVEPPHPLYAGIAALIALAWEPALGRDRATESARNAIAPIALSSSLGDEATALDVAECARRVLEHRRDAFAWSLTDAAIDHLSRCAGWVWEGQAEAPEADASDVPTSLRALLQRTQQRYAEWLTDVERYREDACRCDEYASTAADDRYRAFWTGRAEHWRGKALRARREAEQLAETITAIEAWVSQPRVAA